MSTERIFWTSDEEYLLAQEVARQTVNKGSSVTPKFLLAATRDAQDKLLPVSRQRPLRSLNNIAPFLNGAYAEEMERLQTLMNHSKMLAGVAKQEVTAVVAQTPVPAALEVALAAVLDQMVDRIADRVIVRMREEKFLFLPVVPLEPEKEPEPVVVPAHPVAEVIPPKKHDQRGVQVARPRVLTIGVVGLLNGQAQTLKRAYPSIEFRFLDGKTSLKHPPSVDYMIGMVGFMSHAMDGMASKHFGMRYRRVHTGMSALTQLVWEIQTNWENNQKAE